MFHNYYSLFQSSIPNSVQEAVGYCYMPSPWGKSLSSDTARWSSITTTGPAFGSMEMHSVDSTKNFRKQWKGTANYSHSQMMLWIGIILISSCVNINKADVPSTRNVPRCSPRRNTGYSRDTSRKFHRSPTVGTELYD